MKKCNKCLESKDESLFSKRSRNKDGLESWCKSCTKSYTDSRRDALRENDKRSYWKNREFRIARLKKYRHERFGAPLTEQVKNVLSSRKKKIPKTYEEYMKVKNERGRIYKAENKDKITISNRKYQQSEHGKIIGRLKTCRYRAAKASLPNTLTKEQVYILLEKQNGKCACCEVVFGNGLRKMEIDHIFPQSMGGGLVFENVQLLCRSCNARKRDKHIRYIPEFSIQEIQPCQNQW